MANLLRIAFKNGFKVVGYDTDEAIRNREKNQAANLYEIINKHPIKKIVVLSGWAHINSRCVGEDKGNVAMVKYLQYDYGIYPLTINQTYFRTYPLNDTADIGDSDWYLINKESLLTNSCNDFYTISTIKNTLEIKSDTIISISLQNIAEHEFPISLRAYYSYEIDRDNTAVPVFQKYISQKSNNSFFPLNKGKYVISYINSKNYRPVQIETITIH